MEIHLRDFGMAPIDAAIQTPSLMDSEKSLARSMLFYSRNCSQPNLMQFLLYINSDCMYIGDLWLQLWLKNHCKNTGYCSIFHLSLLLLLNNYQYNCNNTVVYSVSVDRFLMGSSFHCLIVFIGFTFPIHRPLSLVSSCVYLYWSCHVFFWTYIWNIVGSSRKVDINPCVRSVGMYAYLAYLKQQLTIEKQICMKENKENSINVLLSWYAIF